MQQVQSTTSEKPAGKKPARKKEARKANRRNVEAAVKRETKKKGKTGLIAYLRESLLAGKTTEQILEGLPKACPQSKAGPKDVSIVRSKLRREGKLPAA